MVRNRISCLLAAVLSLPLCASEQANSSVMGYLTQLADPSHGIGSRTASTVEEQKSADLIAKLWQSQGYQVTRTPFTYQRNNSQYRSENLEIQIQGKSEQILVIGAHYDSTGTGSHGATDNASSVAVLLALSERLSKVQPLPQTVRLIAFGAEEVSLQGAKAYVTSLSDDAREQISGMINLDTIAGGDLLYIHSAQTKPYDCVIDEVRYNSDTHLRDELLALSASMFADDAHKLHPEYPGYPAGETGGWSDHAPFACAGVPIAYIEATNFNIKGKNGFDGYAQSVHPTLWDCFDTAKMTACERKREQKWGNIWHTKYDRIDTLEKLFPGRLDQQMQQTFDLLYMYLVK